MAKILMWALIYDKNDYDLDSELLSILYQSHLSYYMRSGLVEKKEVTV